MRFSISLVLALIATPVTLANSVYTLHHRISHLTLSQLPYTPYGTIHIANDSTSVSFQPAPSLSEDLASFSSSTSGLDNLYYQLALQQGDQPQSSWDFTSVKACHLPHVTSQTFVLHTENTEPFAVDYFVSPIPPDGSCSKVSSTPKLGLSPFAAFAESVRGLNTTIILKPSHAPPLYRIISLLELSQTTDFPHLHRPELRKPQPVTPTGQPVQPVPEKTFIQKYWMYIAVAFVALVLTGGEEEGPRKQARA